MILNFIELIIILQLITTRNSFNDKNTIKPQAIKRLVQYYIKIGLYARFLKVQLIIVSSFLECTKNNTLRPLAQKRLCTSAVQTRLPLASILEAKWVMD